MRNKGRVVSQLEYSKVSGCLIYVMTCTRRDIAFIVGTLSRYTSNPSTHHWQAIWRVFEGNYGSWFIIYLISFVGIH